jgi:hypothetical protein
VNLPCTQQKSDSFEFGIWPENGFNAINQLGIFLLKVRTFGVNVMISKCFRQNMAKIVAILLKIKKFTYRQKYRQTLPSFQENFCAKKWSKLSKMLIIALAPVICFLLLAQK